MLRSHDDGRYDRWPRDRRVRRHVPYHWCLVILLAVSGFALLANGTGEGTPTPVPSAILSPASVQNQTGGVQEHAAAVGANGGMGAANTSIERTQAAASAGTCWNPLDVTCWLQNAAQWIAQQIMNALQPVVTALLQSPLSILTQTPPADTYNNPTVITWWTSFLGVADLALACFVVIGGYNVMVGRYLGLRHSELVEFLPRLLLAFGAASFSLYFLGLFIDLENALCAVAINLAGTSILTNIILSLFQENLLGVQMAVRLALLWVLLVLAGPGLACLAFSQTVGFGRLWLSLTASMVMVQFFQVVTLALGGTLITAIGVTNILGLDRTIATILICIALLYLVLRIPGIVSRSALRPMLEASATTTGVAQGAVSYVANVAPRLLAFV
ncbi:MAG: hypothetical protein ACYDER_02910 [Ktedonobacteraceae bacterium]